MRIAHLTSAHPRDDVRIFLKECQSLFKHGHTVSLVVADGRGDELRSGVNIIDVGAPKSRMDRMLQTTRKVMTKAIKLNADVYHIHDPELLTVCIQLKKQGKKVIFDAHEDVPKQILGKHYLRPAVRRMLSILVARYEQYICARLDGVITATPTIRDKFASIHPNSVDINNFPLMGELESQVGSDKQGDEVCYIGGIAEIRGIKEIIKAIEVSSRSNIRLNLAGAFVEPHVESQVRNYPGWEKVVAWGVLDREGVREVLSRSRIGLVTLHPTPNYLESLPIKMFEYMSAGIPVIASNFPIWRNIVEGSQCGLCVDPLNPMEIGRAVDELLTNPEKAQWMGRNGQEAVKKLYNWSAEEQKLLSFYDHFQKGAR